jgi:pimeloyl-ACP methyl ester carboxylesterase
MRSLSRAARPGITAAITIVCLPGAYHCPEDFLAAGFDARVRERGLPIDLWFVDAELEHLGDRGWRDALHRELVLPVRAAGCPVVWLAGISLGGFMALEYAAAHPGAVDGLCLLAPYLGNRLLTREIARAQGLAAWTAGELAEADEERRLWRFIQAQGPDSRLIHLGYGREDRFARAHGLLADALPPSAVDVVPGGHDWGTWTTLWENFLDWRFTEPKFT